MKEFIKKNVLKLVLLVVALSCVIGMLAGCEPYTPEEGPIYSIKDDEVNEANKDHTDKTMAIEEVCDSITALKKYLNTSGIKDTGYYFQVDFEIDTENDYNFILKIQANMYTYPYEDEYGNIDLEALAIHNETIKKNDILLEWYDGISNEMLIGMYYDGINANAADPGNIMYLNIQGYKRYFKDFGDTVLYQQLIRLLTSITIDDLLGVAGAGEDGGVAAIRNILTIAITNNYKKVLNNEITSIFFNDVDLTAIQKNITSAIQELFAPFGDKIDPLTKKYLGFEFSQMAKTELQKIYTNIQVFTQPDNDGVENLMRSTYLDVTDGAAIVDNKSVPFTAHMGFIYGLRPSSSIKLDKENYKFFDDGDYEFVGNLYIPAANLNLDALIRTDVYDDNNEINNVFAEFRDIANGDLIIGAYYRFQKTFLDVEGLQHLYGGIHLEDIGLPKAYVAYYEPGDYDSHGNLITSEKGFNLADFLHKMNTWMNNSIVSLVDSILKPKADKEPNNVLEVIMAKMTSTEKDPNDPLSLNTVSLRIDINLIKDVLREGGYGTFTTRDLINMVNASMSITLDEIASILGIASAEVMVEKNWFRLTLDVDTNQITIQMYSDIGIDTMEEDSKLLWQLDLTPTKVGEKVKIADVDFSDFKELGQIKTYSAVLGGQFMFSSEETVDLSELLGAMMGDLSGKNTPYILPDSAKLSFDVVFDQYIRGQYLANGRWTDKDRNAFALKVYCTTADDVTVNILNTYANDASFKSTASNGDLMDQMLEEAYVSGRENGKVYSVTEAKAVAWEQLVTETINSGDDEVLQMLTQMTNDLLKKYPDANITDINAMAWDQRYAQRLGYVWVDFVCLRNREDCQDIPKFKIREDIWLAAMSAYINKEPTYTTGVTEDDDLGLNIGVNKSDINFSIMSILSALMEDSYVVFQPEQIEITTSNETVQNLFGVDNLIGNITAEVGLIQRVFGVDEIEPEFANYYVGTFRDMTRCAANGNLDDMSVDEAPRGPYTTKLHDTIRVTYVYEKETAADGITPTNRSEYRDLKFDYDPESIRVVDNATLYFPEIYGEFMGRKRSYTIYMQGGIAEKALIKALADPIYFDEKDALKGKERPLYIFEPLNFTPYAINDDRTIGSDITNLNRNFTTVLVSNNSEVIYNAHFLVDWDKVTVSGAYSDSSDLGINLETEVVIAEGFMGELRFDVRVIVLNRQTELDKYYPAEVEVSTSVDSMDLTESPVVGEITIDPFDYALKKSEYFELNFLYEQYAGDEDAYERAYTAMEKEFVAYYFSQYEIYVSFEDYDVDIVNTRDTIRFVINPSKETIDNLRAILIEEVRSQGLSESIQNLMAYPAERIVAIYNENLHNALKIMSNYNEGEKFSYGFFDWSFDQNTNVRYYDETDITPNGGTTYLHTYFRGQWIALKVVVDSRTIDYIMFDGETDPNYYMVDVLDSTTYSIPLYPTVVFVEKDPATNSGYTRVFPFPMNWSNPAADNIKMGGSYEEKDLKAYLISEIQKQVSINTVREKVKLIETKTLVFDEMLAYDGYFVEGNNLAKVKDKAAGYLNRNGKTYAKHAAFDNLLSDMKLAAETDETLAYIEFMTSRQEYYNGSVYQNQKLSEYKSRALELVLLNATYQSMGNQYYTEGGAVTKAEAFDKLLAYYNINNDTVAINAMYDFLTSAVTELKTDNVEEINREIRTFVAEYIVIALRKVAAELDENINFGNYQNELVNAPDDSNVDLFCEGLFMGVRENPYYNNEFKNLISETVALSATIADGKTIYINRPFKNYDTSKTSSYISMKNYLNGDVDWFRDYIVTVTVECPAKEIPLLDVTEKGYVDMPSWNADAANNPPTEDNMVDIALSNVKAGGSTARGYYYVDPFDLTTIELPSALTITFLRRPNGTETYEKTYEMTKAGSALSYTLQWITDEINPDNDFIKVRSDGKYVLDITKLDEHGDLVLIDRIDGKKEIHLRIMAKIGNDTIGFKEVSIVVRILTAEYSKVLFYYGELGDYENSLNLDDMMDSSESTDGVSYSYAVDTYQGFDVPNWFVTIFGADSRRLHLVGYKNGTSGLPDTAEADGTSAAWLVKNEVYAWNTAKRAWDVVGLLNGFSDPALVNLGGIVPLVDSNGNWYLGTTNVGFYSGYDENYNPVSGYRVLKSNQDESWLKVVNLGIKSNFDSEQRFVVGEDGRWIRFTEGVPDTDYEFKLEIDLNGRLKVNGITATNLVLVLENKTSSSAYASEYSDRRIYPSDWAGLSPYVAGTSIPLTTTLGAGNITMSIRLTINVFSRTPNVDSNGHIFLNMPMIWDEDRIIWVKPSFSMSFTAGSETAIDKNIVFNNLTVNSEGKIENLGFGRLYDEEKKTFGDGYYSSAYYPDSYQVKLDPQNLVDLYPYELFKLVFSEVYLIFPDGDRDDMDEMLSNERNSINTVLQTNSNNKDRAYDAFYADCVSNTPNFAAEIDAVRAGYISSGASDAVAKTRAWDYSVENIAGRALEKLIAQYKRSTDTADKGSEMEAKYNSLKVSGATTPMTKAWNFYYENTVSYIYENSAFKGRSYKWNFIRTQEIENFEGLFAMQDIMTLLIAEQNIARRFDLYLGQGAKAYDVKLKLVVNKGIRVTGGAEQNMDLENNTVKIKLYNDDGTATMGADGYVLGENFNLALNAEYGSGAEKKEYVLYYGPNYYLYDFEGRAVYAYTERDGKVTLYFYDEARRMVYGLLDYDMPVYYDVGVTNQITYYVFNSNGEKDYNSIDFTPLKNAVKQKADTLDKWYVESSSDRENIPVGSFITAIPSSLLYSTAPPTLTLSTLTPIGLRVKSTFSVQSVFFGDYYTGKNTSFEIGDGATIVIDDLYAYWPLSENLKTNARLPSTIVRTVEGQYSITISGIEWKISENWYKPGEYVNGVWHDESGRILSIDYFGIEKTVIATAEILGWYDFEYDENGNIVYDPITGQAKKIRKNSETITLYIKIDSAMIRTLPLDGLGLETSPVTVVESESLGNNVVQTIYVDAYKNSNYGGIFNLPANLSVKYGNGVIHNFTSIVYKYNGTVISRIPYNVGGIELATDEAGTYFSTVFETTKYYLTGVNNKYEINLTADIGAGQTLSVKVHFYDKTVLAINPILKYDDEDIRNSIYESLAAELTALKSKLELSVNSAKLIHWINKSLDGNKRISEAPDFKAYYNYLRTITVEKLVRNGAGVAAADELVKDAILNGIYSFLPVLYPNPSYDEEIGYNYAAVRVIALYGEDRIDAYAESIVDALAAYADRAVTNATFLPVETLTVNFVNEIYNAALLEIINDRISDAVLGGPSDNRVYQKVYDLKEEDGSKYLLSYKNLLQEAIDVDEIVRRIRKIEKLNDGEKVGDAAVIIVEALFTANDRLYVESSWSGEVKDTILSYLLGALYSDNGGETFLSYIARNAVMPPVGKRIEEVISEKIGEWFLKIDDYNDGSDDFVIERTGIEEGGAEIEGTAGIKINGSDVTEEAVKEFFLDTRKMRNESIGYEETYTYVGILRSTLEYVVSNAITDLVVTIGDYYSSGSDYYTQASRAVRFAINDCVDSLIRESMTIKAINMAKARNDTHNSGKTSDSTYQIDPYGDYILVPSMVEFIFPSENGGDNYYQQVNWNLPSYWNNSYENGVSYEGNEKDTYTAKENAWNYYYDNLGNNAAGYAMGAESLYDVMQATEIEERAQIVSDTESEYLTLFGKSYAEDVSTVDEKKRRLWQALEARHSADELTATLLAIKTAIVQEAESNKEILSVETLHLRAFERYSDALSWDSLLSYAVGISATEIEIMLTKAEKKHTNEYFTAALTKTNLTTQYLELVVEIDDREIDEGSYILALDDKEIHYDYSTVMTESIYFLYWSDGSWSGEYNYLSDQREWILSGGSPEPVDAYPVGQLIYSIKTVGETRVLDEVIFYVSDPFVGQVSFFPSSLALKGVAYESGKQYNIAELPVTWDYDDKQIGYSGTIALDGDTGKYGKVISGYIKNKTVGQEIKMRLVVSKWEYNGIRQYSEESDSYNLMSPVNFIFSKLVDYSAQEQYQVMFRTNTYSVTVQGTGNNAVLKDSVSNTGTKEMFFYPEDSVLIGNFIDDVQMQASLARRNYILYWDDAALSRAYVGGEIKGNFGFGNTHKNAMTQNNAATYKYETSYIENIRLMNITLDDIKAWITDRRSGEELNSTQINSLAESIFAEYKGFFDITGVVALVLDPFDAKYGSFAAALGTLNQKQGQDLGNVRVLWEADYTASVTALSTYLRSTYPELDTSSANKRAQAILMNNTMTEAEKANLIGSLMDYRLRAIKTELSLDESTSKSIVWDTLFESLAKNSAERLTMEKVYEQVYYENDKAAGNVAMSYEWAMVRRLLSLNEAPKLTDRNEKILYWNDSFSRANSTEANRMTELLTESAAALKLNVNDEEAKAYSYDIYVKYLLWKELISPADDANELAGTVINELNKYLNSVIGAFVDYSYVKKVATAFDGKVDYYSEYTLAGLDELYNTSLAERVAKWTKIYNSMGSTERANLDMLVSEIGLINSQADINKNYSSAYDVYVDSLLWDEYYAIAADKKKMDVCLTRIEQLYNNRTLYYQKSVALGLCMLVLPDSMTAEYTINIKALYESSVTDYAARWTSVINDPDKAGIKSELLRLITEISVLLGEYVTQNTVKATAYEIYQNADNWDKELEAKKEGSDEKSEMLNLSKAVTAEYPNASSYRVKSTAWKRYKGIYDLDEKMSVKSIIDRYTDKESTESVAFTILLKELSLDAYLKNYAAKLIASDESFDMSGNSGLISGGIKAGKNVTLLMQLENGGYIYTQTYTVRLIFLDCTPVKYFVYNSEEELYTEISTLTARSMPTEISFAVKNVYKVSDYDINGNPYDNFTQFVFDCLDEKAFSDYEYTLIDKELYSLINAQDIVWDYSNVENGVVSSKSFTVNGKLYYTDLLKLNISE